MPGETIGAAIRVMERRDAYHQHRRSAGPALVALVQAGQQSGIFVRLIARGKDKVPGLAVT
jgi:hypothetical protein